MAWAWAEQNNKTKIRLCKCNVLFPRSSPNPRIKSLVLKFLAFGLGLKAEFLVKIFIMLLRADHIYDYLLKTVNLELKS